MPIPRHVIGGVIVASLLVFAVLYSASASSAAKPSPAARAHRRVTSCPPPVPAASMPPLEYTPHTELPRGKSPALAGRAMARALRPVSTSAVTFASLGSELVAAAYVGDAAAAANTVIARTFFHGSAATERGVIMVLWNLGANPFCGTANGTAAVRAVRAMADAFDSSTTVTKIAWAVNATECYKWDADPDYSGETPTLDADRETLSSFAQLRCVVNVGNCTGDATTASLAANPFAPRHAASVLTPRAPIFDPMLLARDVAERLGKNTVGVGVFVSKGSGKVAAVMSGSAPNEPRMTFPGAVQVLRGTAALPAGTMVALWPEDESCFCRNSPFRAQAESVVGDYTGVLWVATMNPCVVNPDTGAIGVREIAIPPFDVYNDAEKLRPFREAAAAPIAKRPAQVRWRGASTGSPWLGSQRQRTLARFAAIKKELGEPLASQLIDVGVSTLVQGVGSADVPIFGGRVTETEMAAAQVQIDLDGNANAWRGGQWKLFAGAAVLKVQGDYVEWYYRHMVNGTHVLWYDTPEELADAAVRLVKPPQSPATIALLEKLSAGARDIAQRFHTIEALESYTERAVRCAEAEHDPAADWRMRRASRSAWRR